jgi:hypothetical protein
VLPPRRTLITHVQVAGQSSVHQTTPYKKVIYLEHVNPAAVQRAYTFMHPHRRPQPLSAMHPTTPRDDESSALLGSRPPAVPPARPPTVPPDLSTANRRPILRLESNSWPAFQRVTGLFHLPQMLYLRPRPQAVLPAPMNRPVSCRGFQLRFFRLPDPRLAAPILHSSKAASSARLDPLLSAST